MVPIKKVGALISLLTISALALIFYRDNYVPAREQARHYQEMRRFFLNKKPSHTEVVVLGDSLVQFGGDWATLLESKEVVNLGISGDTVDGVSRRLEDVYRLHPKVCFVMVGMNDFPAGDPADVARRYGRLLDALRENAIVPVAHKVTYVTSDYLKEKTGLDNKIS